MDCLIVRFSQVNIWVPQPEKQLDVIKVTGLVANVERAKLGLLERVKELQAEQEDRVNGYIFSISDFKSIGAFFFFFLYNTYDNSHLE